MDLHKEHHKLEREMSALGAARYRHRRGLPWSEGSPVEVFGVDQPHFRRLMEKFLPSVVQEINRRIRKASEGRAGRMSLSASVLSVC